MPPPAVEIARQQIEAFRKKFGRDPGPDDPLFFDPDKDVPTRLDLNNLDNEVVTAMRKTGVEPHIIYAYKKTGLIGIAGAIDNWPADRRAEWQAAIDEYFALEDQAKAKRD
jgi:hypothetical protein